jgi:hypothetical protein
MSLRLLTYKDLKELLNSLPEEELNQPIRIGSLRYTEDSFVDLFSRDENNPLRLIAG